MKTRPITSGKVISRLEAGGFILTETLHAPFLEIKRHDHERANINFTIGGSFRETIGSKPQECVPTSILVKPEGAPHADIYGPAGAHCLIIEVAGHRLNADRQISNFFDRSVHIRNTFLASIAMNVYREIHSSAGPSLLLIEGLLLELVSLAARSAAADPGQPPRWLSDARDLLHQRFAERLSLSVVAERVGIHPAHLARMFRKMYGCSVGEYIVRLRIEHATQELHRCEFPLSEVATRSGFYDQSQFTNVFKRQTGMTPSEYRRFANTCSSPTKNRLLSKTA